LSVGEAVFSASQVEPLLPPAEPASLDPPLAEVQGDSLAWASGPLRRCDPPVAACERTRLTHK